jgi:prevent-host-death family protein
MESYISATEAARKFSDILNRVRYGGEEFVVKRGRDVVCRIIPDRPPKRTLADFVHLLHSLPKPDEGYWKTIDDIVKHQPSLPDSPWRP